MEDPIFVTPIVHAATGVEGETSSWRNPVDYPLVRRVTRYLEKAAVFTPPEEGRRHLLSTTMLEDKPYLVDEAVARIPLGVKLKARMADAVEAMA